MLWTSRVLLRKNIEPHTHNVHEVLVCLVANVEIQINDVSYYLSPGQSIFIPAQYPHAIYLIEQVEAQLLFVCIDPPSFDALSTPNNQLILNTLSAGKFLINKRCSKLKSSLDSPTNISNDSYSEHPKNNYINHPNDSPTSKHKNEMLAVAKELAETPNSSSPLHASLKEALFMKLLFTHLSSVEYVENTSAVASLRISKAQHWINDNYTFDITLEMVAKQVNMSRSHFARQFRHYTGFSVIEYLLKVRCDAVANLLASSNADITEVAFSAGFSNLSHFYRHFKRRYGITPKAFRQMINHQGLNVSVKSA